MTRYPYPELRRNQTIEKLNQLTEAEYDRLEFQQIVLCGGEHLTPEPVKFGRAFDDPPLFTFAGVVRNQPIFTFSEPLDSGDFPYTGHWIEHLTIGVAEWVKDEQGMYVGAFLWYKMTLTQVDFGEQSGCQ